MTEKKSPDEVLRHFISCDINTWLCFKGKSALKYPSQIDRVIDIGTIVDGAIFKAKKYVADHPELMK